MTNQADGSNNNVMGFPYKAHSLMVQNEPFGNDIDYTFMNLGFGGCHIIGPGIMFNFYELCQYQIFKQSLPHAVFIGFGGMDTLIRSFNAENFTQ